MSTRVVPVLLAAGVLVLAVAASPAAHAASGGPSTTRHGPATAGRPARALAATALARRQARGTLTGIVLGPSARPLGRVCVTAAGPSATTTVVTRPDGR